MSTRLDHCPRAALPALLATLTAGCFDSGPSPTPPAPPAENDAAFSISGVRGWALIGNTLTPGHDTFEIAVSAPADVAIVDLWLDGAAGVRLDESAGLFRTSVDLTGLAPGEHQLLLAADRSTTAFAAVDFKRSHPLYVVVGTDWDDPDTPDASLALQDQLHVDHAELKLTHFVGPYTFTAPEMTTERIGQLVDWLKHQRDAFGDEIGVHIHPYCNFVDTTAVNCRTEPSCVYDAGDPSGYTVISASYTEQEYTTLLLAANALFESHGLGMPTSFRTGAWTADLGTLRALVNAGYSVDSDAYNWARMEEWIGVGNGVFYEWVKQHWSSINDTSQPYHPSTADILVAGETALPLLEVPLNGVMADYVTGQEMIEIFTANWPGDALVAPVSFAIGYHPPNFNANYQNRMQQALNHVDQFLASTDAGPVVYSTFRELTSVWL